MTAKPVALRKAAAISIERAVAYYAEEGTLALSVRFVAALEAAFRHVRLHPETGSTRYGAQLSISGLRSWPLSRFPYLLFYFDRADSVDVIELLHTRRDMAALLSVDKPT